MTTHIFVFGSNTQGRHGKGSALEAKERYGAIQGWPSGRQGNAYAIITKELRTDYPPVTLRQVGCNVAQFLDYARRCPECTFLVTPIGCGLAGFKPEEIAPMFRHTPSNVKLPFEFKSLLEPAA